MRVLCFLLYVALLGAIGCSSPHIKVVDTSGYPVSDAVMNLDHPSFNGTALKADSAGVISYPASPRFEVVQIRISSPTKGSLMLFEFPPPATVVLDGTNE